MTPIDPGFGEVFASMRRMRGSCPAPEHLAQFVAGAADDAAQVRDHVAMCGRCDALVTRMRAVETRLGRDLWWGFVRKPALGWAAAVAIAVSGALYLRTTGHVTVPSPAAIEPAEFLVLREAQRGAAEAPHAPGTAPSVVLGFTIPAQAGYRYWARIVPGEAGAPRELSVSAKGDAYVTIDRRQFPPGQYACVVKETGAPGQPGGRTFTFPFSL
jgi:hypothetical protein